MEWVLVKKKIRDLKPHPRNPRKLSKHDYEHLQKSLDKFGLIDKPIINTDDMIIGGHQRIAVLKKSGAKEVECWAPKATLSEKEIDELNIRLNRATGEWEWDTLANEWEVNDLLEWGFTEEELSIDLSAAADEAEENAVLEPPKDPITRLGDLYELGEHRLICGDSTLPEVVAKVLDGAEPILMVTDPPYGVEYDPDWRGKAGKGQKASGKVKNDDRVNWSLAWHLFPGSVGYVWHAGKFCSEVQKSLEQAEYEVIAQIIWAKQNFALSRGDYHWQHEPCWYTVKKGHNHNWQGARDQSTVWEISNLNAFGTNQEDERTAHSTQKPLECMRRPIRNNSAEGEGVYDPFLGSGTTLIAAEQLKRKCYGIELDPAYCNIIVQRWIKYRKEQGLSHEIKRNGSACKEFAA